MEQEVHGHPNGASHELTMNRRIRRLAAEELGLPTAAYRFAATEEEFRAAVAAIGIPQWSSSIMSSSGKGQSVVKSEADVEAAWNYARQGARGSADRVIVEEFIPFDYEITLLTVRHVGGTAFCPPIGHVQIHGDYHESWQPMAMAPAALTEAQRQAKAVTDALGGRGIFGVELFIKGEQVWFSEVSPRPHDTGMVTMISEHVGVRAASSRHPRAAGSGRGQPWPAASHVIQAYGVPEVRHEGAAALELGDETAPLWEARRLAGPAHGRGLGPGRYDR